MCLEVVHGVILPRLSLFSFVRGSIATVLCGILLTYFPPLNFTVAACNEYCLPKNNLDFKILFCYQKSCSKCTSIEILSHFSNWSRCRDELPRLNWIKYIFLFFFKRIECDLSCKVRLLYETDCFFPFFFLVCFNHSSSKVMSRRNFSVILLTSYFLIKYI